MAIVFVISNKFYYMEKPIMTLVRFLRRRQKSFHDIKHQLFVCCIICPFFRLSVGLFVLLSVCPFVCLSVCLFVHLSVNSFFCLDSISLVFFQLLILIDWMKKCLERMKDGKKYFKIKEFSGQLVTL